MPSVQRTQEKSKSAVRCSLNVASTAGFFQPRISNPWLPIRGSQSVASSGLALDRRKKLDDKNTDDKNTDDKNTDDKNTDDKNTEGAASSAPTN